MSKRQDDLDLLLSLQDRVLETPPGSPSHSPGYLSNDELRSQRGPADMSVFREAVEDCLDYQPKPVQKAGKLNRPNASTDPEVEKFSGLRIRKQLVTPLELSDHFSDIRFVRLSAIKNSLRGDTLTGCWATAGVLTEKGIPRTSSNGKSYCIWKLGCLDEDTISVFLFGDAYETYFKEQAGVVFALFNCAVRKDALGGGFSLSVYSANQMLKMGTSVDYGVCKGKRKDGMACTVVLNKRRGIYCKFHKSKESQKYSSMRTELNGGNLRTAFRSPSNSEGIYLVDPLSNKTNSGKTKQPLKLLSVEGLKKALSNGSKVTTNTHSQGLRFLAAVTGKTDPKDVLKESKLQSKQTSSVEKRKPSSTSMDPSAVIRNQQLGAKRMKTEKENNLTGKTKPATVKMMELHYISSDEGF
ncbi:MCM10-like protein [Pyrus ussuriensis x Pyrus communis]|uniref:MCM10-like protein n=1 Tax=Pyrus ussuriensis x Pyrus communis TaxID=2448454 RepID=A0A5N5FHN7_9ROSA|nr:MCM10-like protein [Pyrus ussuriensis x Pyrus communis]